MPARLASLLSKDPREILISLADDAVGPVVEGLRGRRRVDETFLLAQWRRWHGLISATVRVPLQKCLVRELTLPKAALRRADEVLTLDLRRTTPFLAEDVLTGWYCPQPNAAGDTVLVHQVILKRPVVSGIVSQLEQARIPLKAISVVAGDGSSLGVNLLEPARRQRAPVSVASSMLLKWLVATVVILNIVDFGLTTFNLKSAIATADQALLTATTDAQALRRKVGEAQASATQIRQPRLRKLAGSPVVATLEEVTRILPTSTMLTEFRVEGTTVQLDGHSSNASELVGLLAASPMFSNVGFASPVTRDTQRGTERFQIKLQVSRAEPPERTQAPGVVK